MDAWSQVASSSSAPASSNMEAAYLDDRHSSSMLSTPDRNPSSSTSITDHRRSFPSGSSSLLNPRPLPVITTSSPEVPPAVCTVTTVPSASSSTLSSPTEETARALPRPKERPIVPWRLEVPPPPYDSPSSFTSSDASPWPARSPSSPYRSLSDGLRSSPQPLQSTSMLKSEEASPNTAISLTSDSSCRAVSRLSMTDGDFRPYEQRSPIGYLSKERYIIETSMSARISSASSPDRSHPSIAREIERQHLISKLVEREQQFVLSLGALETVFIHPLRNADPGIIPCSRLEEFIEKVFGDFIDLRTCHRSFLSALYSCRRDQRPIFDQIGDVVLSAVTSFRLSYRVYLGALPTIERAIQDEIDINNQFGSFLSGLANRSDQLRYDLINFLRYPREHLFSYSTILEALFHQTPDSNLDLDALADAVQILRGLTIASQLRTFQLGHSHTIPTLEWADIVPDSIKGTISPQEKQRQLVIFSFIKKEMDHLELLELIKSCVIDELKHKNPPIIAIELLSSFLDNVFPCYEEIISHHQILSNSCHTIQRQGCGVIQSILGPLLDAANRWTDSYITYTANVPIAIHQVEQQINANQKFGSFLQDMIQNQLPASIPNVIALIQAPILHLDYYKEFLDLLITFTPMDHTDYKIHHHILEGLRKVDQVAGLDMHQTKQRVELSKLSSHLIQRKRDILDLELLSPNRSLIHSRSLQQYVDPHLDPDFAEGGWREISVFLLDNFLLITNLQEDGNTTKYLITQKPIPLELLGFDEFLDPPKSCTLPNVPHFLHPEKNYSSLPDTVQMWPFTLHDYSGNDKDCTTVTLFARTHDKRSQWNQKLEHAMMLKTAVATSQAFQMRFTNGGYLSAQADQLSLESGEGRMGRQTVCSGSHSNPVIPTRLEEFQLTAISSNCSVIFTNRNGNKLLAIGTANGVWVGSPDLSYMEHVLQNKNVTQCAVVEELNLFLLLSERTLLAYQLETLTPSTSPIPVSAIYQKVVS